MVQVIKCRHGKIFAACWEPECYVDKDWLKELAKYIKGGCTVEMRNCEEWKFDEKCDCNKKVAPKKTSQLTLLDK